MMRRSRPSSACMTASYGPWQRWRRGAPLLDSACFAPADAVTWSRPRQRDRGKNRNVTESSSPRAGIRRAPSRDILSGDASDVYFRNAEEILSKENLDPVVVMEVF